MYLFQAAIENKYGKWEFYLDLADKIIKTCNVRIKGICYDTNENPIHLFLTEITATYDNEDVGMDELK